MTKLLVDVDILLYRFAHANEYHINWGDTGVSEVMDTDRAIADLDEFITSLEKKCKKDETILCRSSDFNFRYLILDTYKHNRAETIPPELVQVLSKHIDKHYHVIYKRWLEGDDVLGILATMDEDKEHVIATIDKDLQQIPRTLYNWNTDTFTKNTEDTCDYLHYLQTLTGDTVDGYSGCPGIGPKRGRKLLSDFFDTSKPHAYIRTAPHSDIWAAILDTFHGKGLSEEQALQQAQVARICRAEDFDWTVKKPIWWRPKTNDK